MEAIEVNLQEYQNLKMNYFLQFDSPEFNELNKNKCQELLYLIFRDGRKNRFGVICGISDQLMLKIPFSAPHTCFTALQNNTKTSLYHACVRALISYASSKNLKGIYLTFPPKFYAENHISNFENAFFANGFKLDNVNLNHQFYLADFNDSYIANLDIKARQKLLSALKSGLNFAKVSGDVGVKNTYEIIKINRRENNRPLHVSLEDVFAVSKIIDVDFFIVSDGDIQLASAIIYRISNSCVSVVYWGGVKGSESLKAMNFLSFKIFEYYKSAGFQIIDLGISTNDSVPNFGLCDFKQSVGCKVSTKHSFMLLM
jgi:hypothetical protein